MYQFAYLTLVASLLFTLMSVCVLAWQIINEPDHTREHSWPHISHWVITGLMTLSCIFLLYAFISNDFRLEYVQNYSSKSLAFFYRVTAFWAGQSGSLLFWAWTVALSGLIFPLLPAYKRLTPITRSWYWCFYFAIMAFFLLILTTWSNPFAMVDNPRPDGFGLNPLLQNIGMIFHPPILFLGYGGFVIPGCLALAQSVRIASNLPDEGEPRWAPATRGFTLIGWAMLTAGIILGCWWAYMELGWGGYWAWDPVENASLIPWLAATAYLHTGIIESRRDKLHRTNVFFMAFITVSAFFATYLVRSGVIQSLHAFGATGLGQPFLIFVALSLLLVCIVCYITPADSEPLDDIWSKEGLLLAVAWVLLALSGIILVATMWPVLVEGAITIKDYLPAFLAAKVPAKPMGLEPPFYNRVCLPLFAFLGVLLMICPNKNWSKGFMDRNNLLLVLGGALFLGVGLCFTGMRNPLALITTATSFAALVGIIMLFINNRNMIKSNPSVIAHGVHIGLLIVFIGVAFSGPYQSENEIILAKGDSVQLGKYNVSLDELYRGNSDISPSGKPYFTYLEASLKVTKDGKDYGFLNPQMRQFPDHEGTNYAEVSTIFGLGDELYATLTRIDSQNRATVHVNINPLVNWLWIGGVIMSLIPFLVLRRRNKVS